VWTADYVRRGGGRGGGGEGRGEGREEEERGGRGEEREGMRASARTPHVRADAPCPCGRAMSARMLGCIRADAIVRGDALLRSRGRIFTTSADDKIHLRVKPHPRGKCGYERTSGQ
jgi:hypothetical protein